ncbi:hypothetical protein [Spirosoma koreense]
MMKVLMGMLLVTTTALAQTSPDAKRANVAEKPTGSTESTTRSKAKTTAAASTKPLPQPSLKEKLESGDRAIPSYKQEKDAGIHKGKNRYAPRRTESGVRKDTMHTKVTKKL